MEQLNDLASTFWGSYIGGDYQEVGIQITKKLVNHWGPIRKVYGSKYFPINKPYRGEITADEFEQIVRENIEQGYYQLFESTFYNPTVTDEVYVNRLKISKRIMVIEEYEGSRPFQTEDPNINRQRTEQLLEVMVDIAHIPEVRELWVGDKWSAFIGEPCFLYRPWELYEKVQDTSANLTVKDEVLELTKKFQQYVPQEVVMNYLIRELGEQNVNEIGSGKIQVQFYEEELMNRTIDVDAFLKEFQEYIDGYMKEKGIRLLES
ncbi:hypothetical protein [Desmospora activa]|uniref:Uncharacterized protein n=1 Tax=Desmospora activa DSM 45169 TaxID=1121389 RepID=A0A2T4Z4J6_9BACL|nr:hypothetical protein [Desmospora activa]PTM56824.1 hypothetical protein C8J48_3149 [Desmospora activa DSM 45169]